MHVRGSLPCKFGTINYAITEQGHAYLEGVDLTYRGGTGYHVNIHVYRQGTTWFIRDQAECYASRRGGNVTRVGQHAIQDVMVAAWNEYINKPENQPLLRQAEVGRLGREVAALDEKIVQAEVALALMRKNRGLLQAQLERL